MAEQKIVEATFTSANTGGLGKGGKSPLAGAIEAEMSRAVQQCYDKGITDPEKIKAAMQAAREHVKNWFAEQELKMIEAQKMADGLRKSEG